MRFVPLLTIIKSSKTRSDTLWSITVTWTPNRDYTCATMYKVTGMQTPRFLAQPVRLRKPIFVGDTVGHSQTEMDIAFVCPVCALGEGS